MLETKSARTLKIRLKQWREFGIQPTPFFENEYSFGNDNCVIYKSKATYQAIKTRKLVTSSTHLFTQWPYKNKVVFIDTMRIVV